MIANVQPMSGNPIALTTNLSGSSWDGLPTLRRHSLPARVTEKERGRKDPFKQVTVGRHRYLAGEELRFSVNARVFFHAVGVR